jgi:predicted transcriptional regulator
MIRLLEEAVAKARSLSEADQHEAAEVLLWALQKYAAPAPLDDETIAAIDEGIDQAARGEFASDREIAALWKRHGL